MPRVRKPKIAQGTALDESVDDLIMLKEDETEHELMVFNKTVNYLKKNDITKISQLKNLFDNYGEEYTVKKLSTIRGLAKKTVENILTKASCYEYPKGYLPNKAVSLPQWVLEGYIPEDNDELLCPEEGGKPPVPKTIKEEKVMTAEDADNISIDVKDYASNLVSEDQLPEILLSIIFDAFENDSITPERLNNSYIYEQQDIYYNDKIILIHKDFLMNLFSKKCRNLKTINNLNLYTMFHVALKNLSCVYNYFNKRDSHTYYWGRKPNLLGSNTMNYIEIYRLDAEAMMNRRFNITASNDEEFQVALDYFGKPAEDNAECPAYTFCIIPDSCSYENGRHVLKFNVAKIQDKFAFTMKAIDWKPGSYSFNKADLMNGDLMLSRGFSDKDYDTILELVGDFLKK